jgi:iron(III) transport system ATP-binding protein
MKEGRIEQIGDPMTVYRNPVSEYVADFLGARNKLTMTVEGSTASIDGQPVEGALGAPGDYALRVRTPDVRVRRPGSTQATTKQVVWLTGGRLVEILPSAERDEYVIEHNGSRVFAAVPHGTVDLHPGDAADVGLVTDAVLAYRNDTLTHAFSARRGG